MAYSSARGQRYAYGLGTGRSIAGVIGIFAAFGVGLALIAFAAAFALAEPATDPGMAPTDVQAASGVSILAVGLAPVFGALILSAICGAWAGTRTRSGGRGLVAGAVGALGGVIALFIVVGIGFALGVGASGLDVSTIEAPETYVSPQLVDNIRFLASASGLVYLAANVVAGGLAGAVAGAIMPSEARRYTSDEDVVRGPSRAT
ncbi:MAG TPA: hypothetical protein VM889_06850 [Candidatus Thermoplasmatota archaeon]|nr:hypothetical protein [Candidatus Thermoplasmatota archaeon]